MPVEVQVHTVSHFKAQVNAKVRLWKLKSGGAFTVQNSLLNIGCLLLKSDFVASEVVGTVAAGFNCLNW